MTQKTKPKSYIRGKRAQAACALIDHLNTLGITAGVGYNKKSDGKLLVDMSEGDRALVPSEWAGFQVEIITDDETKEQR